MTAFFVTGGSGYIGRHVLAALRRERCDNVTVLLHRDGGTTGGVELDAAWKSVVGRLEDPGSYTPAIPHGAVIVHLAGLTGNHSPAAFDSVNVRGTATLLQAALAAGASHFVFVSSIAATYRDRRFYPYAESKRAAEALVTRGGMPFTILRPTIVLGAGGAGQAALTRLALLPRPALFGRGDVLTQPVHVEDVGRMIVRAAAERWTGEEVDVGGPDVVALAALLARIRAAHGAPDRAPVRVPLTPLRVALALFEPFVRPLLPVTAGQLALFANDSTATPSARLDAFLPEMKRLDAVLEESRHAR